MEKKPGVTPAPSTEILGEESKPYDTEEEAKAAAKEALKNVKTKDSFSISKGVDNKYYYHLWNSADKQASEDKKDKKDSKKDMKDNKKETAKEAKANPKAAPKTGIAGLSTVAGLAAVSVAGIVATRKKEN